LNQSVEIKKRNILLLALLVSVLIGAVKLLGYFLTGSNGILTDALESIVNILASAVALYSVVVAARPKDLKHPYGYGKIEFISAGFEGALIILSGLLIIIKSFYNFFQPHQLVNINYGIYLSILAGLANLVLGYFLVYKGKEFRSAAINATGNHLLTDAVSSIGLVVGLLIVYYTESYIADNMLAIILGLIIIRAGYLVAKESYSGVMDTADKPLLSKIAGILNKKRKDNWIDIHNLRVIKYGANFHIDCHLTLPWYINVEESHQEVNYLEKELAQTLKGNTEVFIHVDPCVPNSCSICQIKNCEVRKHETKKKLIWTTENLLQNNKHFL
jgi:cation diffusion facilitator family transporter